MNIVTCDTYLASAVIGLQRGYGSEIIFMEEFKQALRRAQERLKVEAGVVLSVKHTPCEIVFLGQDEPSVTLEFINYPKFPLGPEEWRRGVLQLVEYMMDDLHQNRVVVVFQDQTVMLERSGEIDPRIRIV